MFGQNFGVMEDQTALHPQTILTQVKINIQASVPIFRWTWSLMIYCQAKIQSPKPKPI